MKAKKQGEFRLRGGVDSEDSARSWGGASVTQGKRVSRSVLRDLELVQMSGEEKQGCEGGNQVKDEGINLG